ncbi:PREDICTED: inositol-trisphosphate 3-kinase A-like isoform X2 [Priapulus caudatus]|uniref:Kinase n=1 Tax=Priapulus caudatus TaxID=37621 RepID=A0ABM1E902_PRICU|nr:PREDICTED: inositol-trisphosphate 3-kinase A-like isoform X2 [Priapulus caudatus]
MMDIVNCSWNDKHSKTEPLEKNALDLVAPACDLFVKYRKSKWIQLSGHEGSFFPAGLDTIWKKHVAGSHEAQAYKLIMEEENMRDMVPTFHQELEYKGSHYIELTDLLHKFTDPCIMDIKMGCRTFLESEVKNPALRTDLYDKMVKLDADEPTAEEHSNAAVTKLRYMQFREMASSTSTLSFRIEGIKLSGHEVVSNGNLKKVRSKDDVLKTMSEFLLGNSEVTTGLSVELRKLRDNFEKSSFFSMHEVIGSSLLLIYDDTSVGVWMIDLAKTAAISDALEIDHRSPWILGNHEDGYLHGLDNLIEIVDKCQ